MTPLEALHALGNPAKAADMAAYHKADRPYLGIATPAVEALVAEWRAAQSVDERIATAATLWDSNIHEARIAAGKLLTQARIRPDDGVWAEISRWVPQFDAWAIADQAAAAGSRRLSADPARLEEVEGWTTAPNMWTRRAALVMTLPWSKGRHLSEADTAHRERILGWAAGYVADKDWFIQKSIGWWLRSLSKHDPERVRSFLAQHGHGLKPFARREAGKYL